MLVNISRIPLPFTSVSIHRPHRPPHEKTLLAWGGVSHCLKTKEAEDSTLTEQGRKISSCISDEVGRGKRKKEASAPNPRRWQLSALFPGGVFFEPEFLFFFF